MKNFKYTLALVGLLLAGFAGHAVADQYDFAYKNINEFPVITAAPATGDYEFRYVAATNKVSKILSTGNTSAGAFNGTVGATTPGTGAFTTLSASGTLTVTGVDTENGGVVSKVTNDLSPTYSTGITANPVSLTTVGTCTVAAVNAGTCIPLVGVAARTISVTHFDIVATGSAATCTGVLLEDTNGTPVVVATLAAATLTSGAHNVPLAATLGVGFGAGSGLTVAKGVQIIVNGSGCTTTTSFKYAITYNLQ